jgi:sulfopyruvate decarboxylase subunit alpha
MLAELRRLSFTHVLSIPDSESRSLHDAVAADPHIELIMPAREGESVAIAAGLWTGGAKPLLLMQNTGVLEAGDAIRGCGLGPRIPLRMVIGWRGYKGVERGVLPVDSAYTYTEPVLEALGIPAPHLSGDADLPLVEEMDRTADRTSMPAAVLVPHGFVA